MTSGVKIIAEKPVHLMEGLSRQPWHEIGNGGLHIAATSDFSTMVVQLVSILEFHLKQLVKSRVVNGNNNTVTTTGPDPNAASKGTVSLTSNQPCFLKANGELDEKVCDELREYIIQIGRKYNNVHFHSFEHATHVTISVNKLLSMMVNYSVTEKPHVAKTDRRITLHHINYTAAAKSARFPRFGSYDIHSKADSVEHDMTFGLGSNPMARFALVFSALIHDVDHRGVSNAQLVDEFDKMAIMHNDISVTEQNSLQVAFAMLMKQKFATLRQCIMPTFADRSTFRKLVIGIVLVTDISSPDRMQLTKSKWSEAFEPNRSNSLVLGNSDGCQARTSNDSTETTGRSRPRRHSMFTSDVSRREIINVGLGIRRSMHLNGKLIDAYESKDGDKQLQASAVLDLIMNMTDVAHTMQGFSVFCKWNRRLYKELLVAHRNGRNSWDPSVGWYHNQINFFDAYIIPLAQRLEMCMVFGSHGSIPLYFAMENKRKWTEVGHMISIEMMNSVEKELFSEGCD